MKTCTVCRESKPLTEYFANKRSADGKGYRCKHCDTHARKTSRNSKGAEGTRYGYRRRALLSQYGLTMEQYDSMLANQGGKCAVCGTSNPVGEGNTTSRLTFSFAVDHCHKTNKVRGLLCNPCNRGIGFLRDDPKLLEAAITYLSLKENG